MPHAAKMMGAVALAILVGLASSAEGQTVHRRHVRPVGEEGRQILVQPRESWLTAGTNAPVGTYNSYAIQTVTPGMTQFTPGIDHTVAGVRGQNRLPNNFTVPGCCAP